MGKIILKFQYSQISKSEETILFVNQIYTNWLKDAYGNSCDILKNTMLINNKHDHLLGNAFYQLAFENIGLEYQNKEFESQLINLNCTIQNKLQLNKLFVMNGVCQKAWTENGYFFISCDQINHSLPMALCCSESSQYNFIGFFYSNHNLEINYEITL
jgi:hypothetical protein